MSKGIARSMKHKHGFHMTKNQNLYPRCHTGISEIGRYRYHATTLVGRHYIDHTNLILIQRQTIINRMDGISRSIIKFA